MGQAQHLIQAAMVLVEELVVPYSFMQISLKAMAGSMRKEATLLTSQEEPAVAAGLHCIITSVSLQEHFGQVEALLVQVQEEQYSKKHEIQPVCNSL